VKPLDSYLLSNEIVWVDPKELKPSADNPRRSMKADPKRWQGLKDSISKGFFAPILVEKSSMAIIGGHCRTEAAVELAMKAVPVLYLKDLTPSEKIRIRATDNAAGGFNDLPMLSMQMAELSPEELNMVGLDVITLDIVSPLGQEEQTSPPEENETWKTMRIKMHVESYNKALAIIDAFCQRERCKPGTALERILEDWSLTPGNSPHDLAA
jgi:hypothetical protein